MQNKCQIQSLDKLRAMRFGRYDSKSQMEENSLTQNKR